MWFRFCLLFGMATTLLTVLNGYSDGVVASFISFMLHARKTTGEAYAWVSIRQYLTGVRNWHEKHGLASPTGRPRVRRALVAAKRFCRNLGRVKRKWPISAAALRAWSATLDFTLWNVRVLYAAVLLAYFGLYRVSEVAHTSGTYKGLRRGNVLFSSSKTNGVPDWVTIKLEYTKTDTFWRYGGTAKLYQSNASLCVVTALWDILRNDNRKATAPLFVLRAGRGLVPLHRSHVSSAVKSAAKCAGLPTTQFDTHSLRAGGACALWAANYSVADIAVFGRWRSDCFRIYLCQSDARIKSVTRDMATAPSDGVFYAQIHDQLRVEPIPQRTFPAVSSQ